MSMPAFLGPFVPLPAPPTTSASPRGGAGASRTLPLAMQPQEATFWCWAATATSVAHFYDAHSTWTQCALAGTCLSKSCCADHAPCDEVFVLDVPLRTTGNLQGAAFAGPATRAQVQTEIDAGRVICCFVDWGDTSGHFVAISGYDRSHDDVQIDDSFYGRSTKPFDTFVASYQGKGSWTFTYLTEA